jgi:hypothetical protein
VASRVGQRRTLPPSAVVLGREQPSHRGAAAAEPIGDRLLGQSVAAPAPGALLAGLAGPSQHEKGKEDQRQQNCGGGGDGGHGWWRVVLWYCNTADPPSGPYCNTL